MAQPALAVPNPTPGLVREAVRPRRGLVARLARDPAALAGVGIVGSVTLAALAAPWLAPADPAAIHPTAVLLPPSSTHPLGTDNLGRDLLSRLLYGARPSLATAAVASSLTMTIGVVVGTVSGYCGGRIDDVMMRVVDILLAFPSLILALAITGMLGPGLFHVMVGMVSVWWVGYARIVRGMVLSIKERQFVEAARALGASTLRILSRHILPNVIPPVIVLATLDLGSLVLAISGLNFLGLGVQPPTPEWGAMLNEGRPFLMTAPQMMLYPGMAISLVVIGFNLLGDALRDALDPRLRGEL